MVFVFQKKSKMIPLFTSGLTIIFFSYALFIYIFFFDKDKRIFDLYTD